MKKFILVVSLLFFSTPVFANEVVLLDVRTPAEHAESHIKDAQLIDFYAPDFKAKVDKLDRSKSYRVFCRSGGRSSQAVNLMRSMGFKNVENAGGLKEAARKFGKTCEGSKASC